MIVTRSDPWGVIGAIGSVVAAFAALTTILYARATIHEAKTARAEARTAHKEETEELRSATQATVAELRALLESAAKAHGEEMREREQALNDERVLQRLVQLERIAETLLILITVARDEQINPPPEYAPPTPFRATLIPALLRRLQTAILILTGLGGPDLLRAGQLAGAGYNSLGESPMKIVSGGIESLEEITSLIRNHESLKLKRAAS